MVGYLERNCYKLYLARNKVEDMIVPLQMSREKHIFNSPKVPKAQTQFLAPGKQSRARKECYTENITC